MQVLPFVNEPPLVASGNCESQSDLKYVTTSHLTLRWTSHLCVLWLDKAWEPNKLNATWRSCCLHDEPTMFKADCKDLVAESSAIRNLNNTANMLNCLTAWLNNYQFKGLFCNRLNGLLYGNNEYLNVEQEFKLTNTKGRLCWRKSNLTCTFWPEALVNQAFVVTELLGWTRTWTRCAIYVQVWFCMIHKYWGYQWSCLHVVISSGLCILNTQKHLKYVYVQRWQTHGLSLLFIKNRGFKKPLKHWLFLYILFCFSASFTRRRPESESCNASRCQTASEHSSAIDSRGGEKTGRVCGGGLHRAAHSPALLWTGGGWR